MHRSSHPQSSMNAAMAQSASVGADNLVNQNLNGIGGTLYTAATLFSGKQLYQDNDSVASDTASLHSNTSGIIGFCPAPFKSSSSSTSSSPSASMTAATAGMLNAPTSTLTDMLPARTTMTLAPSAPTAAANTATTTAIVNAAAAVLPPALSLAAFAPPTPMQRPSHATAPPPPPPLSSLSMTSSSSTTAAAAALGGGRHASSFASNAYGFAAATMTPMSLSTVLLGSMPDDLMSPPYSNSNNSITHNDCNVHNMSTDSSSNHSISNLHNLPPACNLSSNAINQHQYYNNNNSNSNNAIVSNSHNCNSSTSSNNNNKSATTPTAAMNTHDSNNNNNNNNTCKSAMVRSGSSSHNDDEAVATAATPTTSLPPLRPSRPQQTYGSNIYVASLPETCTDAELLRLFAPFGPIVSVKVMCHKGTNRCKGYGFVLFEREEDAGRAQSAMIGHIVGGNKIQVRRARITASTPLFDATTTTTTTTTATTAASPAGAAAGAAMAPTSSAQPAPCDGSFAVSAAKTPASFMQQTPQQQQQQSFALPPSLPPLPLHMADASALFATLASSNNNNNSCNNNNNNNANVCAGGGSSNHHATTALSAAIAAVPPPPPPSASPSSLTQAASSNTAFYAPPPPPTYLMPTTSTTAAAAAANAALPQGYSAAAFLPYLSGASLTSAPLYWPTAPAAMTANANGTGGNAAPVMYMIVPVTQNGTLGMPSY